MNNLQNLSQLKNHYFVMRHGQSKANQQEIIISHPENGTLEDYSLTELGKEQAKQSAEESGLTDQTIIFASDFSRALETAEIVRVALGADPVQSTELLRERLFGEWEKTDHKNYHEVWKFDETDANHQESGVESVNSVLSRATSLVLDIEKRYAGKDILLVSHGDCLQILQTGFQKVNPASHRSLKHLETAEIRQLELAN